MLTNEAVYTLINDGQFKEALELLQNNQLPINGDEYHFLKGICLGNAQQLEDSIRSLEKCLELNPSHVQACHNLGQAYFQKAEWQKAIEQFNKTLALIPQHAPSHYSLGCAYSQLNDPKKAELHYKFALEIEPDYPQALNNLGVLYKNQGRDEEALPFFTKALGFFPEAPEIHLNLGHIQHNLENFDQAYRHLTFALSKAPNHYETLNNFGSLLIDMLRFEEAIQHLTKCIELKSDYIPAYFNLGKAYDLMGLEETALDYYQQTMTRVSQEGGNTPFFHCKQNAEWNTGFIYLRRGDFERGWAFYEKGANDPDKRRKPSISTPLWQGEPLQEKTLLITSEQGIGDEVMFASCLQYFEEKCSRIVLECDTRLQPLYARSFPHVETVPMQSNTDFDYLENVRADHTITLGSLAISLSPEKHRPEPYLLPDAAKANVWKQRVDALGPGLKVGLSWKGGARRETQITRSINPTLFKPLLSLPQIHWVNCQYGNTQEERNLMSELSGTPVHDWPDADPLVNLDNYCAKLSALDLIISIDNSTVHFSGALGIETWLLLPYVADWRWINNQNSTIWYPSLKLFRQPALFKWEDTLHVICDKLQDKMRTALG